MIFPNPVSAQKPGLQASSLRDFAKLDIALVRVNPHARHFFPK
jgi:hypothetical protein